MRKRPRTKNNPMENQLTDDCKNKQTLEMNDPPPEVASSSIKSIGTFIPFHQPPSIDLTTHCNISNNEPIAEYNYELTETTTDKSTALVKQETNSTPEYVTREDTEDAKLFPNLFD
jgi:hypothetical protein